jgi:hypothetical protein
MMTDHIEGWWKTFQARAGDEIPPQRWPEARVCFYSGAFALFGGLQNQTDEKLITNEKFIKELADELLRFLGETKSIYGAAGHA